MTAPVRIEAGAWNDLRFGILARLLGLPKLEYAMIEVARIWSWQTEHFTPDAPTYVVSADLIEAVLGAGGAAAMVRAQLAEEVPDGIRIRGSLGRIEWLYQRRVAAKAGGEARKRKTNNNSKPVGLPSGLPPAEPNRCPLSLAPDLDPDPEKLSPAGVHAIPPSTEQAPAQAPQPTPPPQAASAPPSELRLNAPLLAGVSEHRALWRELEQARAEAAADLGIQVMPLVFGEVGERDLSGLLAAARARGPDELDKLVRQARHAIAMAKLETVNGEKPFEWFTGAVFSQNNFRRLVAKDAQDAKRVRAGPYGASSRYRDSQPEQPRKIEVL